MIEFNRFACLDNTIDYLRESIRTRKISGDGKFSQFCHNWFEEKLNCDRVFLTTSCTHALEMAALLVDISPGDEVIMPSYTFVSTANAFVLRGAKIVFVDIRSDTMNIDETKIEDAITDKTKAIVPVHYAGVACEMDKIMAIAKKYNLYVIEDAAQAMMSTYKGRALGTIGHIGTYSFHETKNYTSAGEGGLLIINCKKFIEKAEIIREKGTNRSKFFRGAVDKYSWVAKGSSYLMNDLSAAYLWSLLLEADHINSDRLQTWNNYYESLQGLREDKAICLPSVTDSSTHNAHMFYIKAKDITERTRLIEFLKSCGVDTVFHYVPLHSSDAGKNYGRFAGDDIYTTVESERLLRLPMWFGLGEKYQKVVDSIIKFYAEGNKS